MRISTVFFLAGAFSLSASSSAVGQVVHPPGAATRALNWQPAANPDALNLDVDGDNIPDITFADINSYPSGPGQPTLHTFSASPGSNVELALDSVEFDSAHRYQAGQSLLRNARWSSAGSAFIAYTISGNGGLGGRGFLRDGQPGYVAIRKRVSGTWQYWWINVTGRNYGNGTSLANFYGQSSPTVLAAARQQSAALLSAFPNPTTAGWTLLGNGEYQLTDAAGRVLSSGTLQNRAFLNGQALAPGLYWLLVQLPDGNWLRRALLRQ